MHVMSAEFSRFGFLAVTGGKRMHFAAPFVGELEGHMSQTADANNPNTGGGGQVVNHEGRKHSNAAAQKRPDFCHVQRFRQRTHPCPLGSNTIGETAVASDNGPLSSGAKVLHTGKTFVAVEATMSEPAESDALTYRESLRPLTECGNGPGHLMSRHERVLGH